MLIPETKKTGPLPVLFVFHGAGGTPSEYLQLWAGEAGKRKALVLAPHNPQGRSSEEIQVELFDRLLEGVARNYPIDSSRIFLAGTSAGTLSVKWLLLNRATKIRGAIFITSNAAMPLAKDLPPGGWRGPVLFVHGTEDPLYEFIQNETAALQARGVSAELMSIPGAGHEHRPEWNAAIFDWIEKRL